MGLVCHLVTLHLQSFRLSLLFRRAWFVCDVKDCVPLSRNKVAMIGGFPSLWHSLFFFHGVTGRYTWIQNTSQETVIPDRSLLHCFSDPGSTLSAPTSLQSDACSADLWEFADKIHNQFQPLHRDRVWYDDDPGWLPPVPVPIMRGLLPCLADLIAHH